MKKIIHKNIIFVLKGSSIIIKPPQYKQIKGTVIIGDNNIFRIRKIIIGMVFFIFCIYPIQILGFLYLL